MVAVTVRSARLCMIHLSDGQQSCVIDGPKYIWKSSWSKYLTSGTETSDSTSAATHQYVINLAVNWLGLWRTLETWRAVSLLAITQE